MMAEYFTGGMSRFLEAAYPSETAVVMLGFEI